MKALRVVGYVVWFIGCFVIGIVLTAPLDGFKPIAIQQGELFLGKGKQGPHGTDPVLTLDKLAVSGFGVKAKRVHVQLGSRDPDPGLEIDLDEAWISFRSLVSFTRPEKRLDITVKAYGGSAAVLVLLDEKQNPTEVSAEIDDVDLGKVPAAIAKLGVPLEGKIDADLDLDMGKAAEKDAAGHLDIDVKGLGIGAGNIKPFPGGFEVADAIRLGDLKARVPVKQGQGTIEVLKLEGTPDVEAEVVGTINVKSKLQLSRIDADGWFRPTTGFLDKNGKIKSAIELGEKLSLPGAPSLSKAKDDEGRYHFTLKGAVQTLVPQLSKDAGKKAKAKANKATTATTAPPPPAPAEDGAEDAKDKGD